MYCKNCAQPIDDGSYACPYCGTVQGVPTTAAGKSKIAAGLLGIFLGGFGVHNFYLGHIGKAIAQILLTFCFGIGSIWGFIEGILILCGQIKTDAKGIPLRD